MGQQQTTTVAAVEEKGGGTLLRRMILALLVAALMAATMAVSAMPAFAASNNVKANIVGDDASFGNKLLGHGGGGKLIADSAREGIIGDIAKNGK